MDIYFANTDAKSNGGRIYHDAWIERGIAVTSGPPKFRDKLARIQRGDTVLLYANGCGILAVGTATSDTVVETTDTVSPREPHEFHRSIEWFLDLRRRPITVDAVRKVCGQNPLQMVQQVRKGIVELHDLIERRKREQAGR